MKCRFSVTSDSGLDEKDHTEIACLTEVEVEAAAAGDPVVEEVLGALSVKGPKLDCVGLALVLAM